MHAAAVTAGVQARRKDDWKMARGVDGRHRVLPPKSLQLVGEFAAIVEVGDAEKEQVAKESDAVLGL